MGRGKPLRKAAREGTDLTKGHFVQPIPGAVHDRQALGVDQVRIFPADAGAPGGAQDHPCVRHSCCAPQDLVLAAKLRQPLPGKCVPSLSSSATFWRTSFFPVHFLGEQCARSYSASLQHCNSCAAARQATTQLDPLLT